MNRQNKVILLGNGESRSGLDLDKLKEKCIVWGANALYRDWTPDRLVCTDIEMGFEVYNSGYCLDNVTYFRDWARLPVEAYNFLVRPSDITRETLDNIQDFIHESPRPAGWDEFTLSGMDLDKMLKIREDYLKRWPDTKLEDINSVLGENRAGLWITWCAPKDKVLSARTLPGGSDYGFSSGPLSNVLASHFDNPKEVYLVGHDLYSETGENVNNIYKGTNCYIEAGCSEVPPANWINHHKLIFDKFPQISYYKVNPKPISSNDRISRVIEEWKNTPNLEYITQDEMYDRLH